MLEYPKTCPNLTHTAPLTTTVRNDKPTEASPISILCIRCLPTAQAAAHPSQANLLICFICPLCTAYTQSYLAQLDSIMFLLCLSIMLAITSATPQEEEVKKEITDEELHAIHKPSGLDLKCDNVPYNTISLFVPPFNSSNPFCMIYPGLPSAVVCSSPPRRRSCPWLPCSSSMPPGLPKSAPRMTRHAILASATLWWQCLSER